MSLGEAIQQALDEARSTFHPNSRVVRGLEEAVAGWEDLTHSLFGNGREPVLAATSSPKSRRRQRAVTLRDGTVTSWKAEILTTLQESPSPMHGAKIWEAIQARGLQHSAADPLNSVYINCLELAKEGKVEKVEGSPNTWRLVA